MLDSFLELLTLGVLIPWLLGMVFGIFVGSTPGLTATMAVALMVPISFHLEPAAGLALIIGVSFTAIFAGDIPAVYLRIPGTPASAAATLDGHALARQGWARRAVFLDLLCSASGGLVGVLLLIIVAPQLGRFALRFSHFEYFWLAVLGLAMSALVSRGSTAKGLLAAVLGILLSTIGLDVVSGVPRFVLHGEMLDGLHFIPVMIGLFGLAEVLRNVFSGQAFSLDCEQRESSAFGQALRDFWRHKWLALHSSLTGTLIGALPGAGADIAAWGAYGIAQKTSRHPEQFGEGSIEGVVAPTSANNAAVAGAWIPALVFGVPGDAVTAIVLGALRMYDIQTGPTFFERSDSGAGTIFALAALTQLLLLPAGWLGLTLFHRILRLPRNVIMVSVVVFCVVGSYAIRNSPFDVFVMGVFGLVGLFLESRRVPLAPLILGLILGEMLEQRLRTGLIATGGDLLPLFTRPICMVLIAMLIIGLLAAPLLRLTKFRTPR